MHGLINHIYLKLKKEKSTKRHWYNALGGSSVILRCLVSFQVESLFLARQIKMIFFGNTKLISKIKQKKIMDI